jgi:hypothetical protein
LRKSKNEPVRRQTSKNGKRPTPTKGDFPNCYEEMKMGVAAYAVIGSGGEWRIRHDGKAENVYQTKESAFEAAVAAASLALRQGHEVQISVPGSETATGAANVG